MDDYSTFLLYQTDDRRPPGWRTWSAGARQAKARRIKTTGKHVDQWVFWLVLEGALELCYEQDGIQETVVVEGGMLHAIPPRRMPLSCHTRPSGARWLWWHLHSNHAWEHCTREEALAIADTELSAEVRERLLFRRTLDCRLVLDELRLLHSQLLQRWQRWGCLDMAASSLASHLAWRLHELSTQDILTRAPHAAGEPAAKRLTRRVRMLINQQFQRYGSLRELAAALDIDHSHLARCFKQETGQTVGEAIRTARIAAAREYLINGHDSLKEVAALCGYSSLNYFCRQFKQHCGLSPGALRSASLLQRDGA